MSILSNDKDAPATLGQYKVLTGGKAPLHGGSQALAYWAEQKMAPAKAGAQQSLLALVGDRSSLFRVNIADRYRDLNSPDLMRLLEWGVIDWPESHQFVAMIFQRPEGMSLHHSCIRPGIRVTEADIVGQILPSIMKGLKALSTQTIAHGAVRPENIYMAEGGKAVLGECLSAPYAADQPVSLLTIERGLASPLGRAGGSSADDVYALGATLLMLAFGADPLGDLEPHDVVRQKIERGSLGALVGRQHVGSAMMELLRGMLDDNPRQRWTFEVLEQWVSGRKAISTQALVSRQPQRPLVVQGVEHWDARTIADAFSRDVPEAMRLIGNNDLIKWVRRALRDIPMAERIADAVNMPLLVGKLSSPDNRLVARVVMALHPGGPIRYQTHALMPEALGSVLFKTLLAGESPQVLAEMIVAQLPLYWYNIQPNFHEDHVGPIKAFEYARAMLEQPAIGAGIERCLYELSPVAPYLAEHFEKLLIFNSSQLIAGLETVAATVQRPAQPVTRQAAAFFATRDGQLGTKTFMRLVKAQSEAEKALGALEILATVQKNHGIPKLPHLCAWFETLLQPAIDRLHNRRSREAMRTELRKASATGSLAVMISTIENQTVYHHDRDGLAEAQREYIYLDIEKGILLKELEPGARIHRGVGREAAVIVAGIMSVILLVAMVVMQVGQG